MISTIQDETLIVNHPFKYGLPHLELKLIVVISVGQELCGFLHKYPN